MTEAIGEGKWHHSHGLSCAHGFLNFGWEKLSLLTLFHDFPLERVFFKSAVDIQYDTFMQDLEFFTQGRQSAE